MLEGDDADHPDRPPRWWQAVPNLVVLALAIAVIAGALGWLVGNNRALPDPNDADIGFLHDMSWHHEQAREMSFLYLQLPDTDPLMRDMAWTVLTSQSTELGRMLQLLRDNGAPDISPSDISMTWMGMPTPIAQMPGMASADDIERLRRMSGVEADRFFGELMIAHHEGGLHMMVEAQSRAALPSVRTLASRMQVGQLDEISELQKVLAALPA
jgi:uncharacterized protein (DUF305 family)